MKHYGDLRKETRLRLINNILTKGDITSSQRKTIQKFYGWLQRRGLRLESQRAYLQNMRLLFLDVKKDIDKLTRNDIDKYLQDVEKRFKPKTQTERRKFLLLIVEWFFNKKKEEIDLIKDITIKKDKGLKLPDELLTPEEIKKMVAVAKNFRDQAITILLYETGTRKGEFLQLKIKHVDITNNKFGYVTIPMGKTDSRKLPIIYSVPYLKNWLNTHPNRDDPNAPLFVTQGAWLGRAFGEDGLKRMIKILGKRAGIKKKIFPHLLRHSRLTELAKELTEQELKKFSGWTPNSNMASVYVHLSGADVSNKILANAGLIDSKTVNTKKETLLAIECPRCKKINAASNKYCDCGAVLDLKTAAKEIDKTLKKEKESEGRLKSVENKINLLVELLGKKPVLKEIEVELKRRGVK